MMLYESEQPTRDDAPIRMVDNTGGLLVHAEADLYDWASDLYWWDQGWLNDDGCAE